ncbi:hypothetical protein JOC85_000457 [Bacillus mesophilus]|uniref:Uncharacterized protein n=1 Tax=Bacillus mesophilus TaxID=1808955 RepID=A0A6M0Q2L8_9BACI|nr:hypothetical protein [Bacillus mesophilus]NEY70556.1 hypothetical protein [Bacillus mesophilus]
MNKLQIKVVSIATIVMAAIFGYMFWSNAASTNVQQKQLAGDFTDETDHRKTLTQNIVNDQKAVEEIFPLEMQEYQIQNAIHYMSHQKVKADEKWGTIRITPERISRLIQIVELHKSELNHADLYLRILTRWANDDFSQADKDHNAIWKLQNGNIGEATRVLTPQEEQKFIKKHFNK